MRQNLIKKLKKTFDKNQKAIEKFFSNNQNQFNEDLCQLLIKCNIPFNRLNTDEFKKFIGKWTEYSSPTPKILWEKHLKSIYERNIESIRSEISDQYIWLGIDETKDRFGRNVVNVIIGSLNVDLNHCKKYLINMEFMENTSSYNIIQSINNSLSILWPDGIKYE